MRTTVTLDPDVLQMVRTTTKDRGLPFKVEAVAMGTPSLDLNKALALAANLEDEEILRK